MMDSPGSSSDSFDSWLETVSAQSENSRITAQISLRTLKNANGTKEHHVKVISDDEDCFYYRTVINLDEYRRLAHSNNFIASFDNLPQYFRQLLRAAKQENEYGQSYFINITSSGTLGLVPRAELLITTRQAGHVIQNKVLNLPMTSASDSEFKEYLTLRFERMKKEKDQLRRSASFLESQLRRERARSREMEDKNHWLRKELKFTQNLLKSAESIQKHYEIILSLRHRGETGSTVVTIGDLSSSNAAMLGGPSSMDAHPIDVPSDVTASESSLFAGPSSYRSRSPVIHKMSVASSQTSDDDSHSKSTRRKVSFCNNPTDSDSDNDNDDEGSLVQPTATVEKKRPPPRKNAAAVLQFDDQLMEIRKEEERKRSARMSEEEEIVAGLKSRDEDAEKWEPSPRKIARQSASGGAMAGDDQSPLLPSPLLQRPMSPPSVLLGNNPEDFPSSSHSVPRIDGSANRSSAPRIYSDSTVDDCPSDAR